MCHKDLDGGDEVSEGNALVAALPLLVLINIVNENEEIVAVALVVDLALGGTSAGHDGQFFVCGLECRVTDELFWYEA